MELIEPPRNPGFTPGALSFAIAISIGLHLLILWLSSTYLPQRQDSASLLPLPGPLRITIAPRPHTQDTVRQRASPHESTQDRDRQLEKSSGGSHINEIERQRQSEIEPLNEERVPKQPITGTTSGRTVTTPQIYDSAAAVSREIAEDLADEPGDGVDPVSASFDRALNKPNETPGIYSRADGTTRVVTEQGFTYCMKAPDDWRIIDPEDNMPVSVYCN